MGSRPALLDAITELPKLKVIQLLSAGAEQIVGHVPAGITLCNARGAHDAATAEWTVGAHRGQHRGTSPASSGRRKPANGISRSANPWRASAC